MSKELKIIEEKDFIDKPERSIVLKQGGLWEENKIEIQFNVPIYDAKVNCPHLGEKYIVRNYRSDKSYWDTIYANCPRVIVAINEGGYNSTGVCLDCVLEGIKKTNQS